MKITPRILSIPPYVSTSWGNISSLHIRENSLLVISLNDGTQIEVPNMAQEEIDAIFQAHATFSEMETSSLPKGIDNSLSFSIPIKSDGTTLDALGSHMQHNPEQSDLPPIPPHILTKIGSIIRTLGLEDASVLDKAEPNCNCVYCQLSRAVQGEPEEIVEEADLKFRDWEVSQRQEKLYHVVNPLDKNEYYDVFLGEPIGCTCGSKNCEHIRAALNT
jgi:hypothetical protein